MDIQHWHSKKQQRWVNLKQLSHEELIEEIIQEREDGLETEEAWGETVEKYQRLRKKIKRLYKVSLKLREI